MHKSVFTDFNELTKIMKIKRLIPILALPFFINSCGIHFLTDMLLRFIDFFVSLFRLFAGDKIADGVDKIESATAAKVDDAKKHTKEAVDHVTEKTESTGEAIKQKVDDAAHDIKDKAVDAAHATAEVTGKVVDGGKKVVEGGAEAIEHAAEKVKDAVTPE